MTPERFQVSPLRSGLFRRYIFIQSWSQLFSVIVFLSFGFGMIFLVIGPVTKQLAIFVFVGGLVGCSKPLFNCIPSLLRIFIHPQGAQYWASRVHAPLDRYGYRQADKALGDGEMQHYISTVPNVFLPLRKRGTAQLRPFMPRWARWKENEIRVSMSKDGEYLEVVGPRLLIDKLLADM